MRLFLYLSDRVSTPGAYGLKITLTIFVWYDTGNILRIKHEFKIFLKESFGFDFDQYFSLEFSLKLLESERYYQNSQGNF